MESHAHTFEQTTNPETRPHDEAIVAATHRFMGNEASYLSATMIAQAQEKALEHKHALLEGTLAPTEKALDVHYDKYKKSFIVHGKPATMGEVIASRHLGITIDLPKEDAARKLLGEEKRLRKHYAERASEDVLFEQLNYDLADIVSEVTRKQDLLKSKAYTEIRNRSGIEQSKENKQLGVLAEKIMVGFAETIAIDRPDLGLSVTPGNAVLDVEQKIDFILETTRKKRGVGIDAKDLQEEHKSIGIQFTTNTTKEGSKLEQIAKAKERGVAVDDILYVAIDQKTLLTAINQWEHAGKPVAGPWRYMPKDTQKKAIMELFGDVLETNEIQGLLDKFA